MQGPEALSEALDIKWILREPCALSWTDLNDETRKLELGSHLTLWVGANPAERLWTVMIQKTITWKIAQRTVSFDFFMFLDPHRFRIQDDHIPVADEVPAFLREAFPVTPKQGWIRASNQQGHLQTPGHVLMQAQHPNNKPWDGMSLHLLMQLQSLSEAPEFDVYICNQKNIHRVMNRLEHELPKSIPGIQINLRKVYGDRGGVWDAWGSYNDMLVPKKRELQPDLLDCPPRYGKTLAQIAGNPQSVSVLQEPTTPPFLKRAPESQEEGSLQKRLRLFKASFPAFSPTEENTPSTTNDRPSQQLTQELESPQSGHAGQDNWLVQNVKSTRDNESTQEDWPTEQSQSAQYGKVPHNYGTTQDPQPRHASQKTVDYARIVDLGGPLSSFQDVQLPPYTASTASSESEHQLDIKPTLFTTRDRSHSPLALGLAGLGDLITAAVQAQIPAIAAQVQQRILSAEMTALAQTSIAEHISAHMPNLMQNHLSDLHDEWDSAAASLHETKDEAITDIHSERDTALKEIQEESETCYDNFKEKTEEFKDEFIIDIEDKVGKLDDRVQAHFDDLSPEHKREATAGGRNSAKHAVRLFQRKYQGHFTPEQQVRVLLSIAKWNNAEVFMAAGSVMQEALINHWAEVTDHVSSPAPMTI